MNEKENNNLMTRIGEYLRMNWALMKNFHVNKLMFQYSRKQLIVSIA